MAALDRAFEVDAVLLSGVAGILAGAGDPSVDLVPAPVGSMYLRSDGAFWRKYGLLDNEWDIFVQPGSQIIVEPPLVAALPANFSTTGVAFVPSGLELDLAPNQSYWFSGNFLFSSAAANNGIGFAFDVTGSAPTNFGALITIPTGNSSTIVSVTQYQIGTATISSAVGTAGRQYFSKADGVVRTGAVGGKLMLLARSETNSGITLYAGSSIKLEKVG